MLIRQTLAQNIVLGVLSAFLLFMPTLLNHLWPQWDRQTQARHDKAAHTLVVQAR